MNPELIRTDIQNINVKMMTFVLKDDHEELNRELTKNKNKLGDLEYSLKKIEPRIDELDNKIFSNQSFVKLEHGKFGDKIEKNENAIAQVRKIISRMAEQLKNVDGGNEIPGIT